MTASHVIPRAVRAALRPDAPRCYRHCRQPVRGFALPSRLPGFWRVYACPRGAVSLTAYVERTARDPTREVREYLRQRAVPPALVTRHDLRLATRHGPELGRAAERILTRALPPRTLRVVYWRLYPFRGRDGVERRLFVCRRHGAARPVFFVDSTHVSQARCPVCARRKRSTVGR